MIRTCQSIPASKCTQSFPKEAGTGLSGLGLLLLAGASLLVHSGSQALAAEHGGHPQGSDPDHAMAAGTAMTKPLEIASGGEFEKLFLQLMIAHHEEGVRMAELVHRRANHAELHTFVSKMTASQQRDIREMTEWLKQWHAAAPNPSVMPQESTEKMRTDVKKLEMEDGLDFDLAFLTKMIRHHQGAVRMFALVPEKSKRPELVGFAEHAAVAQRKEIDEMQKWLEQWSSK